MSDWHVTEALKSVRQLDSLKSKLTDAELTKVIALEEAALRRKSFLDKLYREARQRAKQKFIRK